MRNILITLLLFVATTGMAKSSYIPSYWGRLCVTENGATELFIDSTREVSIPLLQGKVVAYIDHEYVSADRVKAIKKTRRAQIWAGIAMGLSAASSGMAGNNAHAVVNAQRDFDNANAAMIEAKAANEDLKTLPIDLCFENNSDREVIVNDVVMGRVWYIAPGSGLTIPMGNPSPLFRFRVAYVGETLPNVSYLEAEAKSHVDKVDVDYEDDNCWILPVKDKVSDDLFGSRELNHYRVIDKETCKETSRMSKEEFKEFKKSHKD